MNSSEFNKCITILYQGLFNVEPDENIQKQIKQIISSNGDQEKIPLWFSNLFKALAYKTQFNDINLSFAEYHTDKFDITNFLAELEYDLGFPMSDYGETCLLSFQPISRWVLIDKETVDGDVSIKISSDKNEFAKYA